MITSPNNKIYVGLSKDIYKRWNIYKLLCNFKPQKLLYNSIKKHGYDNHKFQILEECPEEILPEREIFWIKEMGSYFHNNSRGLNLTMGGNIPNKQYGPHTKEHNKKIGLANTGKKHSLETKKKLRDINTGIIRSAETREKMRLAKIGKVSKLRGRKRPSISLKLKGRKSPQAEKCEIINLENGEAISANSLVELSRLSGICLGSLSNLKNKKQTKKYKHLIYKQL
jgi:group I intron endonuclease